MQLAQAEARADKFERLALSLVGLQNESVEREAIEQKAIKGKSTWTELRRRLEADDRKKFNELNRVAVPEGQEG